MRLRELTDQERSQVEYLRAQLRKLLGAEADSAPYLADWRLRRYPSGRMRLEGSCWGHPRLGDRMLGTSGVVELTETYARTESGSLYLLGPQDEAQRHERLALRRRRPAE